MRPKVDRWTSTGKLGRVPPVSSLGVRVRVFQGLGSRAGRTQESVHGAKDPAGRPVGLVP